MGEVGWGEGGMGVVGCCGGGVRMGWVEVRLACGGVGCGGSLNCPCG